MKGLRLIGASFIAGTISSAGFAAEPVLDLPDLTVHALHYPLPVDGYPGVARVVGRADIASTAAVNLQELLAGAGGLDFRSTSGSPADAEVFLRGFGEGSASRILVLVDGLRLNRPDMGGINWLQVPLSAVERVEILRGGQAVIYGHQAIGGVIKITTRGDTDGGGNGEMGITGGSDGFHHGSLFAGASGSGTSVTGSIEIVGADGYRDNAGYHGGSAYASAMRTVGQRGSVRAALTYTELEAERPGPLPGPAFPANRRRSVFDDQRFAESTLSLAAHAVVLLGDHRLSADLALRERDRDWDLSGSHADNRNRSALFSPCFHAAWGNVDWVVGTDLEREEMRALLYVQADRTAPFGQADIVRSSAAVYTHGRVLFSANSEIFAGARLEQTTLTFGYSAGSPFSTVPQLKPVEDTRRSDTGEALSVGWLGRVPSLNLRGWMRLDRVYRYPLSDEIAAYQGFALAQTFNPALQPEAGWQGEAGLGWQKGATGLTVTFFQIDLDDEIIFDFRKNENVNYPKTRRRGLEIEGQTQTGPVRWSAALNGVNARYRGGAFDGRSIYLVPKWTARAGLDWQIQPRLAMRLNARHTARQFEGNDFTNTRPPLPTSTVFDAGLQGRFSEKMHWSVSVNNLFDHRYATVKYLGDWYPADGRTWRASLHIPF